MKVLLRDHMFGKQERPWLRVLRSVIPDVDDRPLQLIPDESCTEPAALVFLHVGQEAEVEENWINAFIGGTGPHLVMISRVGYPKDLAPASSSRIHYCAWTPQDCFSVARAKEFLRLLKEGSFESELLRPSIDRSDLLAYVLAKKHGIGSEEQQLRWKQKASQAAGRLTPAESADPVVIAYKEIEAKKQ